MNEGELFPRITEFDDGSAIIAYSLANAKYIVKHGKEQYNIKSIFVSNYAPYAGTIKTEPTYNIVFEHPVGTEVKPEDIQAYVIEFIRTMKYGNFDKNRICHYIGRRDNEKNNMVISGKVKREIVDSVLEPELEKRRNDRDYANRAEPISAMKSQNEK